MLSLKYGKLSEIEKNPNTYGSKDNKRILKGIGNSLPELMSRNLKLGKELHNKITISSFMNDTESKTKKYLTQFLISSNKRVKDIKTGLSLVNVIKKGTKNLVPIFNHIDNNIIIQNSAFLLREKNIISQKIAKEKHERVDELIKKIRYIIKPTKIKRKSNSHRIIRTIPEDQMFKIKNILDNEIANDENLLKRKINYYKKNLLTLAEKKPKSFCEMAENMYLKSNLKMINYLKPAQAYIREQKLLNLLKIRKHLMNSKKEKEEKEEIDNFEHEENESLVNNGDTIMVIKNMTKEKNNLELKTKKNMRRINSMIDIKLPYFSNYQRTIKLCDQFRKNMSVTTVMERKDKNKKNRFKLIKDMASKLDLIKNEIKNLTHDKIKKGCDDIEKRKNMSIFIQ